MIITKETNTIFKNEYIEFQNNLVENSKTKNQYSHIKLIQNSSNYPGSVILCKFKDKFLLLNNYRYGIEEYCWELPRGYKNKNESLEECAIRELKEEINIDIDKNSKIEKLGEISVDSSILASKVAIYIIEVVNINELIMQKEEDISSYKWLNLNEVMQYIKKGKLFDSFSINAFMLYTINLNNSHWGNKMKLAYQIVEEYYRSINAFKICNEEEFISNLSFFNKLDYSKINLKYVILPI